MARAGPGWATWWAGGAPCHQSSAFSDSSQKRANLWVSGDPDLPHDCCQSGLQFLISGILVITTDMVLKTYLVSGNSEVTPSRPSPQSSVKGVRVEYRFGKPFSGIRWEQARVFPTAEGSPGPRGLPLPHCPSWAPVLSSRPGRLASRLHTAARPVVPQCKSDPTRPWPSTSLVPRTPACLQ